MTATVKNAHWMLERRPIQIRTRQRARCLAIVVQKAKHPFSWRRFLGTIPDGRDDSLDGILVDRDFEETLHTRIDRVRVRIVEARCDPLVREVDLASSSRCQRKHFLVVADRQDSSAIDRKRLDFRRLLRDRPDCSVVEDHVGFGLPLRKRRHVESGARCKNAPPAEMRHFRCLSSGGRPGLLNEPQQRGEVPRGMSLCPIRR